MSRNNIKALEEEINFLKITIQHFNNENIEMKNQIEDLKITLNSDKRLLQEYLLSLASGIPKQQKQLIYSIRVA